MNRRYEKQPLKEGKLILYIDQDCKRIEAVYHIQKIIGQGRSCLVYDASYIDNIGLEHKVRIKECYPDGIDIVRDKNGNLCVEERNQNRFSDKKKRFEEAYKLNVKIQESEDLINSTSKVRQLYYANHTIYFIFEYNMGINYEEYEEKSLESLITRMKTLCLIIEKYHNQGYLHLDIKPSNIFVLPETKENVMLFDFDSVVKIEDIKENKIERISYTEDFAALEQRTGKMKSIGKETDIYSIGAVLFYKMFGRVSDAMDREYGTDYDFCEIKEKYPELTPDFFEKLGEFFNKTLSANISNRYKQMRDVINSLTELQELCSEKRLFIESNFTYDTNSFIGREEEIDEIKQKLQSANIIFLYGIGGIGKTELAKKVTYEYMEQERKATVLFISYQNNIVDSVCSDNVEIQNLTYSDKESNEELFKRKLKIMKSLLTKKDLIIIDNFDVEFDEHLEELFECKCKFLVTTRFDFRDTYYCIKVSPFRKIETVFELFQQYNQYEYNEEEKEVLRDIFELVDRHTMTVELIAKNMRISSIDPLELREKLFTNDGITTSGDIDIRFRKDRKTTKQSVEQHLKIVFDLSSFSEKELLLIRSLSLFGITKIKKALFFEWFDTNLSNDMENLIRNGWIQERESDLKISLHQVILDLVYNNLNPSSENCVEVTKAMLNYAAQKEFESYIEQENKNKICSIFLRRIRGENQIIVEFFYKYCENILRQEDIIQKSIAICKKNNWSQLLCSFYNLNWSQICWEITQKDNIEEQRKLINEMKLFIDYWIELMNRINVNENKKENYISNLVEGLASLCQEKGSYIRYTVAIENLENCVGYVKKIYFKLLKEGKYLENSIDIIIDFYKEYATLNEWKELEKINWIFVIIRSMNLLMKNNKFARQYNIDRIKYELNELKNTENIESKMLSMSNLSQLYENIGNLEKAVQMNQKIIECQKLNNLNSSFELSVTLYSMCRLYKIFGSDTSSKEWKEIKLFYQENKFILGNKNMNFKYKCEFYKILIESLIIDKNYSEAVELLSSLFNNFKTQEDYSYALNLCLKLKKMIDKEAKVERWIQMRIIEVLYEIYGELSESELEIEYKKKCDYFCLAEHDEIDQSYDRKIKIWEKTIESYNYLEDYIGAEKCCERLDDLWILREDLNKKLSNYFEFKLEYVDCLIHNKRKETARKQLEKSIDILKKEYSQEKSNISLIKWRLRTNLLDIYERYQYLSWEKAKEYIKRYICCDFYNENCLMSLFGDTVEINNCFLKISENNIPESKKDSILYIIDDLKWFAEECGDTLLIKQCDKLKKMCAEDMIECY